jgi:hypothetical protein
MLLSKSRARINAHEGSGDVVRPVANDPLISSAGKFESADLYKAVDQKQ